jgi:hypothetical protein
MLGSVILGDVILCLSIFLKMFPPCHALLFEISILQPNLRGIGDPVLARRKHQLRSLKAGVFPKLSLKDRSLLLFRSKKDDPILNQW